MPLSRSCKRTAVSKNIKTLMKEGRPQKQAVAIALSTARKSGCAVKKAPKKGGKAGRAAPCGCSKAGRAGSPGGYSRMVDGWKLSWTPARPNTVYIDDELRGSWSDSAILISGRFRYDFPERIPEKVKRALPGFLRAAKAHGAPSAKAEKDHSKGRATPMRERAPIQIGKSVGGYRFDDHRHTTRQKVGLLMQQWHSSMGDPIYAVGSYYFANVVYPDADVVRRAHSALKRNLDHAKAGQHGWGRNEVLQLGTILAYLDWALDHDYSTGEAKGAGRAMGFNGRYSKTKNEKVGRALEKVLARYGTKVGMFVGKYPVYEFDTSVGKLRGYVMADGQTNNVWFMSRFDAPGRAAKVLHDVNPHSGKWNHYFPNADADAAATHLTRLLARVDVVGEPGRAYGYAKGRTKKRAAKKRGRAGRASGS